MSGVMLIVFGAIVMAVQITWFSHDPRAPDVTIIYLVWVVNHSGAVVGWVRGWVLGLLVASIMPGVGVIGLWSFMLATAGIYLCGQLFDRKHPIGQMLSGVTAASLVALIDGTLADVQAQHFAVLQSIAWTAILVALCEWFMAGVPQRLWPVRPRESVW